MSHSTVLLETWVSAVFAAVLLQVVAKRLRLPAIALLLPAGILLGPEVLGVVQPSALAEDIKVVIALAVAVILFEGGLALDVAGFRLAPGVIRRMLTVGVVITWLGTAAAIVGLYGYHWSFAILAASLTVVTGPTVIGPVLRRVRVRDRLHQILYWEGVLIDPIGVFIAIGCYEWLYFQGSLAPLAGFAGRLVLGVVVGLVSGRVLVWVLEHEWIDPSHGNLFVFSAALVIFAGCDLVLSESGLLAVTVAGLVLGLSRAPRLKEIKRFKQDLTKLAIGVLFILLAARLDIHRFGRLGVSGLVLLAIMMLVLRPLNVLVSTWGSPLDWRERAFLAVLAPRGIVAASMGSLFTLLLAELPAHARDAWFLEVFTYAVIGATVMIEGLGAPLSARLLGVEKPSRHTWLIVGAHPVGRSFARALDSAGVPALLLDNNANNVRLARRQGLDALEGDILNANLFEQSRLYDVGTMLCVTGNPLLDELACHRWQESLDSGRAFRIAYDGEASPSAEEAPAAAAASGGAGGLALWPQIGRLADLERDVEAGEAEIQVIHSGERLLGAYDTPLLTLAGGQVRPVLEPGAEPSAGQTVIALHRSLAPLPLLVRALVTVSGDGLEPNAAIAQGMREMARFQPEVAGLPLFDGVGADDAALNYVGHGVAIPHADCRAASAPLCVVVRAPGGLAVPTFDGDAIRLLFLLVSPRGQAELHLQALGRLARVAASRDLIRRVLEASSDAHALGAIHRYQPQGESKAEG